MAPKVISIVIFTRDDAEWLARCLGTLRDAPPDRPIDVIVFDNASQDRTADLVRGWRGARGERASLLHAERDTSFSEGNNLGLRAARGELVLFLNPDTEPTGAVVSRCAAVLDAAGDIGLLGPRLVFPDGAAQDNGWALPSPPQLVRERLGRASRWVAPTGDLTDVGWLMGCFLMGRTADLVSIGGFDERYWFHGTDLELCARIGRGGWRVTRVESAQMVHRGHKEWTADRRAASRRATWQWLRTHRGGTHRGDP